MCLLRVPANEINTTKLPFYSMTLAWFSGSVSIGSTYRSSDSAISKYYSQENCFEKPYIVL